MTKAPPARGFRLGGSSPLGTFGTLPQARRVSVEPNALTRDDGLDSVPKALRLQNGVEPEAVGDDSTAASTGDSRADGCDLVVEADTASAVAFAS